MLKIEMGYLNLQLLLHCIISIVCFHFIFSFHSLHYSIISLHCAAHFIRCPFCLYYCLCVLLCVFVCIIVCSIVCTTAYCIVALFMLCVCFVVMICVIISGTVTPYLLFIHF
jgi:hypothetical protein